MDARKVTDSGSLEMALENARDQREDMVLWLALQVMMTDDVAWPTKRWWTGCASCRTGSRT
jgi:hypothetical protein